MGEGEAFPRLRKSSSTQDPKLAEVSREVLAAGEVFHQPDGL